MIASRSPANDPTVPARVRFLALAKGRCEAKFDQLQKLTLDGKGWSDASKDWRAPFLPELAGGWANFAALDAVIGDCGSGVMPGRTWIIAPDAGSLKDRWDRLVNEPDEATRAILFHPHEGGDKTVAKASTKSLAGHHKELKSIETLLQESKHDTSRASAMAALKPIEPTRYGFRSFDRQWILPDNRVINRPNPSLWSGFSAQQMFLSALMAHSPTSGPAITATALIPDLHQYKGSFGGRVFALWKDAAATETNVSTAALAALSKAYGEAVGPVDLFAYVAALLAHPAYTARFKEDLIQPGLRVPMTADAKLFKEAAAIGREVIWLHSFGERFGEGRPAGAPRKPGGPTIPKDGAIPTTPEGFPDSIDYDPALRRLNIGTGFIDQVAPEVWAYEVSGKQVLRQWFSYRKKNRERPMIGDKRPPSKLGEIQPDHWLPEYTSELINVLHVLTLLTELEPKQADLLTRVCEGRWSRLRRSRDLKPPNSIHPPFIPTRRLSPHEG